MSHSVCVVRFNKGNNAAPVRYDVPLNLGVRCSLPGWLQRMEFAERKRNYLASYFAYDNNHGQRVALVDSMHNVIVDGWIYEVQPDGRFNNYVVGGSWKRHFDQLDTTIFSAAATVDAVIADTVTNHVGGLTADYSHIVGSGTAVGDIFRVAERTGSYPGDIITALLAVSDSSANIYDYWIQSGNLNGVHLPYPLPYLAARAASGTPNWRVQRHDLSDNPLAGRHIWDLKTRVTTYYEQSTLINNGGGYAANTSILTVDDGSIFTAGDLCRLELTGGEIHHTAVRVIAGNDITINDPLPGAISDNALVVNESVTATTTDTNTTSEGKFWRRDFHDTSGPYTQTQAEQLRDAYADIYNDPVTQGSFTITSPTIRDATGAEWPIWYLLKKPSYAQVIDLYPAAALTTLRLDSLTSFFVTSVDYDGVSMRVTTDRPDARLDVLLKQAGITSGEMIYRSSYRRAQHGRQ